MTPRSLEKFLAVVGTIACWIISIRIWQVFSGQQPMWPLPDLYLIEVSVLSLIGAFSLVRDDSPPARLRIGSTWIAIGLILGFVIIGAWSIGLMYSPIVLIFATAAILADRRQGQKSIRHLSVALIAAIIQIAAVLIIAQWIYAMP